MLKYRWLGLALGVTVIGVGLYLSNPSTTARADGSVVTIKVHDVDELGNPLGKTRTISGTAGASYQLQPLDISEWTAVYTGKASALTGTFPTKDTTVTLHYRTPYMDDNDAVYTIFNGHHQLIGLQQSYDDYNQRDNTMVVIKPDATYQVGWMTDTENIKTFHQQQTLTKGQSVDVAGAHHAHDHVAVSSTGVVTLQRDATPHLVGVKSLVQPSGKSQTTDVDYIGVHGLRTISHDTFDQDLPQLTQEWPGGYTTVMNGDNQLKVKLTATKDGRMVAHRQGVDGFDTMHLKAKNVSWRFSDDGTADDQFTTQQIALNAQGDGTTAVQMLNDWAMETTLATVHHHELTKSTSISYVDDATYTQHRRQVVKHVSGNKWRLVRYNQHHKVVKQHTYHLRRNQKVTVAFARKSLGDQVRWLQKHSV